jgi:hypothetical protein
VITICPYCNNEAQLVSGDVIYPHRPDLRSKAFYLCRQCGAYVGCHPGSVRPLGRLANAELRSAKIAAHEAFDPLLLNHESRSAAYRWLAQQLGINRADCHIGMFDVNQCRRVVEICAAIPTSREEVKSKPKEEES